MRLVRWSVRQGYRRLAVADRRARRPGGRSRVRRRSTEPATTCARFVREARALLRELDVGLRPRADRAARPADLGREGPAHPFRRRAARARRRARRRAGRARRLRPLRPARAPRPGCGADRRVRRALTTSGLRRPRQGERPLFGSTAPSALGRRMFIWPTGACPRRNPPLLCRSAWRRSDPDFRVQMPNKYSTRGQEQSGKCRTAVCPRRGGP